MAKTTVEFNDVAAKELDRLATLLDAPSKVEVIRNALTLYSFIVRELAEGQLAIISGSEIKKVIAVPGVMQTQIAKPMPVNKDDDKKMSA